MANEVVKREDKRVANVLYEWQSYNEYAGQLRIRGKILIDQPAACAWRGDYIVTSEVISFFRVDGQLHLETKNSLYMRCDTNPLGGN